MAKSKKPRKTTTSLASLGVPNTAAIYQDEPLPPEFCLLVKKVEDILKAPLWLLVQNTPRDDSFGMVSNAVYKGFQSKAIDIPVDGRVAMLIESPGGIPDYAYRIARIFQRRVKQFIVVVPQFAKSAATLMALGADELILGRDAELGPLDLQIFDVREERYDSALNTVQSLERLGAYSLTIVDQMMQLLIRRLPKKSDVLLSQALSYGTDFMRPLLEKVDTVDYSRKSRDLKVAEEYAARLMKRAYGFAKGKEIARSLVENFPAHGFVIDTDEALAHSTNPNTLEPEFGLGLKAERAAPELQAIFDLMIPHLDTVTALGRLEVES